MDSQSQDKLNALENERVHRIDANGHCAGNGAVFQLHNGAIVNRDNFTILPMPDHVIAHLNDLAARDKRPIHPDAAIALGNLETKWLTTTFDHVRTPTFIRPSMSHVRAQQLCYS